MTVRRWAGFIGLGLGGGGEKKEEGRSRTGARAKPVGRVVCAAPRSTKAVLKQWRDNAVSVRKALEEGAYLRDVSQKARFCAAALRHFQVSDGVAVWFANGTVRLLPASGAAKRRFSLPLETVSDCCGQTPFVACLRFPDPDHVSLRRSRETLASDRCRSALGLERLGIHSVKRALRRASGRLGPAPVRTSGVSG